MMLNRRAIKAMEVPRGHPLCEKKRVREACGICRGVIREYFQSRHAIFYLSAATRRPSARDLFTEYSRRGFPLPPPPPAT